MTKEPAKSSAPPAPALIGRAARFWEKVKLPFARPPRAKRLYLEVTHRCNLRCISCPTKAGQEKPDALSLAEQKSVLRQARDMGAQVVSLSGSGEPLLYEHLFDLIDFARTLDMRVVMFTNGTRISDQTARFLMERQVHVYFQLPSLNPSVSQRMAGGVRAHHWEDYTYSLNGLSKTVRIPAGLKHLLEYQPPASENSLVNLETLITRVNYTSIPRVAALSKELGLSLHLETPIYTGRAVNNYRQLELSPAQYRHLHEQLADILEADLLEEWRTHKCPVERNIVVWTNGDVAFCSSRSGPVGNVRDEPVARLFARAKRLKRREDARLTRGAPTSLYFHTCPSRRYYELKYGLACNY